MNHIMLDLETFGTRPGSVIRSIGAAVFAPRGIGWGATFYQNIDKESCTAVGLTVDPRTEEWWSKQSQAAKNDLLVDPKHLIVVANLFSQWCIANQVEKVWCHGATFDVVLWAAAVAVIGQDVPWKYNNVRDTRTLYELTGFDVKTVPKIGNAHNALDDCKFQVHCVQGAIRRLAPRG